MTKLELKHQKVIAKLDQVIEVLSGPIPDEEKAHGWDEESRQAFLRIFKGVRGWFRPS